MAAEFERQILRFTSRRLIFKTEATLSESRSYSFGCGNFRTEASRILLVQTLCLRISSIQNSVFPRGRKVNKIKPFSLSTVKEVLCMLNITVGFSLLAISQMFMRSFCYERIFLVTVQ